jgi:hypothetical protein
MAKLFVFSAVMFAIGVSVTLLAEYRGKSECEQNLTRKESCVKRWVPSSAPVVERKVMT